MDIQAQSDIIDFRIFRRKSKDFSVQSKDLNLLDHKTFCERRLQYGFFTEDSIFLTYSAVYYFPVTAKGRFPSCPIFI